MDEQTAVAVAVAVAVADQQDDQLVDALAQLSFVVQLVLTDVAGAHDLSLTQLRLLGILRDRTVAMADLARHLGLDRSSVTGLVDRAEKRALVTREPRPEDGRGVQVRITPDGSHLVGRARAAIAPRVLDLAHALSAQDRSAVVALVTRIVSTA